MASQCKKLFEPLQVGNVKLRNRILMLPATTNYANKGLITDRQREYYVERARGGAAVVTYGLMTPVSYIGAHAVCARWDKDEFIPDVKRLTDEIHKHGAVAMGQLCLRYYWRKSEDAPLEAVGPTGGVVTGPTIESPRELTVEEIALIVEQFADTARRARDAGFDIIEYHCGLGYLIDRFISPLTNKRTDKYGGSLENRMRFCLEILQRSKEKAGKDMVFSCRMSADDFLPGGTTLEESTKVAAMMQKAGAALLNVQTGWLEGATPLIQASVPQGAFVDYAAGIKKAVTVPVVAALRIIDPLQAEKIISDGKADMIGMCRALIADPHLPNKAKEGRFGDIRTCLACCECLDSQYVRGEAMGCSVNPFVGREITPMKKAAKSKRITIVGGGPGGMQAAVVASERGHKVTLFEKGKQLGGQLVPGAIPPFKGEIKSFREYLVNQVKKSGAEVKLNQEITADAILKSKPDVVIVATGGQHFIPKITGIDGKNVATAVDVLNGIKKVGNNVVIIGGGLVGCETAEFLCEKGKKVTIMEMLPRIGQDIGPSTRWVMRMRLKNAKVGMETGTKAAEITDKGVKAVRDGKEVFFPADSVIVAAGMVSSNDLAKALQDKVSQLIIIGDSAKCGKIRQATESGARAAEQI